MHSLRIQLSEILRLRTLLWVMMLREVRARVSGTVLGLVWLYAQPLLTIIAYLAIFEVVFKARLGQGAPTSSLALYLVVGMVPWLAFSDAVSGAMRSLVDAGGLLQKNALSPVLFPARSVAASALTYLPPILLAVLLAGAGSGFSPALLWLPVLLVFQLALSFLVGYVLAILAAALRDVLQLATFALSLGVFLSPVLFTMSMVPEAYRWLLWLNPMTPVIMGYQAIALSGQSPDMSVWGAIAAWLVLLAWVLDRLIDRSRDQLVDWL